MIDPTLRWLKNHRVAVLKGGWSRERPISLKTGAAVQNAFEKLGVRAIGIDVKRDLASVLKKKKIDFAFIALHGAFGEDGGVQKVLERLRIPYNGCGPEASALAMDKVLSKKRFVKAGVPTPRGKVLSSRQSFGWDPGFAFPVFVKPFDQGSAIGASRVDKPSQLQPALKKCFAVSKRALVEEFINGRELTVGILGSKVLPVVEIIPEHAFYDFHSKYAAGGSRHIVPAKIPKAITRRAQRISMKAFRALGCKVYGRIDVMYRNDGKLFVLEANTIPGMTSTSLLPDAARAIGISFEKLVLHICRLSLNTVRK